MCGPRVSTPKYQKPPSYAMEKAPDNAALYEEARQRATQRGGGNRRSTLSTPLGGIIGAASTARRTGSTVLG